MLQFSAQRVCLTRKLTSEELQEKCLLERQAAVLEFFEEFYAGFTQLLLQLYIIIVALDEKQPYKARKCCCFMINYLNDSYATQIK